MSLGLAVKLSLVLLVWMVLSACPAMGTTHPLSSLPVLNSRPSSTVTVYLNFIGDIDRGWGVIPAYDIDNDPTTSARLLADRCSTAN